MSASKSRLVGLLLVLCVPLCAQEFRATLTDDGLKALREPLEQSRRQERRTTAITLSLSLGRRTTYVDDGPV